MVFQQPVAVLSLADTSLGEHTFSYFHLESCVLSFPLLVVSLTSSFFGRVELGLGNHSFAFATELGLKDYLL